MDPESAQRLVSVLFDDDLAEELSGLPRIEGYTLIQEIGRGGGGVVYEGIVDSTGKPVAVKILWSRQSRSVTQTLLEMDRLTKVRSPVVPHVFEHGWHEGSTFIVTEFIHGVSPIEFAKDLDTKGRVELLAKIADAVGVLNERGIIHCDLKPSNVLVTSEGNPVILDLGISVASSLDSSDLIDQSGRPIGTLAYMAPEQARCEHDGISTRWDVYGLGAIGYQLLTGSTPHELPESVTMGVRKVGQEQARGTRELNPKLPKALGSVLEKACAWEPSDRYETAQLFRDDLRRWLRREPVIAGPQTGWARTMRLVAKHPALSMVGLAVVIFVLTIAATWVSVWWVNMRPYEFRWNGVDRINSTALIARSKRELHRWRTKANAGIVFPGKLIELEDQEYAVIGLGDADIGSGDVGLVGYQVGSYDKPAWVARQQVPEGLSYAVRFEPGPHVFRLHHVDVFDIFEEIPGNELVSVHLQRRNSVSVIQIHRADGELLCEYYHDGWLQSVFWEPRSGVLVALGPNSDGTWLDRGAPVDRVGKYPIILFGIHPALGEFGQIIQHPGLPVGEPPLWYRCVLPEEAYSAIYAENQVLIRALRGATAPRARDQGHIEAMIGVGVAHITIEFNADGQVQQVWATDGWARRYGMTPETFYFGELPARVTDRKKKP